MSHSSVRFHAFITIVLAVFVSGCASSSWTSSSPEVEADTGRLRGSVIDGVNSFKGIPFAAAPVGELRWVPPQPGFMAVVIPTVRAILRA